MKTLTLILFGLLTFFPTHKFTSAAEPDKDQFCFLGSEMAHYAINGGCSALFNSADMESEKFKAEIKIWEDLAQKGDPNAQFNMGKIRYLGVDLKDADSVVAAQWYTRAAIQGYSHAQNNLGSLYRDGDGVAQDFKTAIKWYSVAAQNGNAGAQTNLGVMFQSGAGVPQNYQAAFDWYLRAAEQGYGQAQFNLGLMYEQGLGTKKNPTLAHMWYNLAAAENNESAQNNRTWLQLKMTPEQIEAAQNLATECIKKNFQGC